MADGPDHIRPARPAQALHYPEDQPRIAYIQRIVQLCVAAQRPAQHVATLSTRGTSDA